MRERALCNPIKVISVGRWSLDNSTKKESNILKKIIGIKVIGVGDIAVSTKNRIACSTFSSHFWDPFAIKEQILDIELINIVCMVKINQLIIRRSQ